MEFLFVVGELRERFHLLSYRPARRNQIRDESLGCFNRTFIFCTVSQIMALRKNAPDLTSQSERVGQDLKHDV